MLSVDILYITDFGLIYIFVSRARKEVDLINVCNIQVLFKEDLLYNKALSFRYPCKKS